MSCGSLKPVLMIHSSITSSISSMISMVRRMAVGMCRHGAMDIFAFDKAPWNADMSLNLLSPSLSSVKPVIVMRTTDFSEYFIVISLKFAYPSNPAQPLMLVCLSRVGQARFLLMPWFWELLLPCFSVDSLVSR